MHCIQQPAVQLIVRFERSTVWREEAFPDQINLVPDLTLLPQPDAGVQANSSTRK